MELRMKDQDYAVENGGTVSLTGTEELLARALFRLTVRRDRSRSCRSWEAGCTCCGGRSRGSGRALPGSTRRRRWRTSRSLLSPRAGAADGERLWVDVQLYSGGQTLTASAEL